MVIKCNSGVLYALSIELYGSKVIKTFKKVHKNIRLLFLPLWVGLSYRFIHWLGCSIFESEWYTPVHHFQLLTSQLVIAQSFLWAHRTPSLAKHKKWVLQGSLNGRVHLVNIEDKSAIQYWSFILLIAEAINLTLSQLCSAVFSVLRF